MIPDIKKILYTTDLSENAQHAFGYAASLANRYGASLTVLNVIEDTSPTRDMLIINVIGEERWEEIKDDNKQEVIDSIKTRLENFCTNASNELPECPFITDEIVVKIGNPVEEILKQADETGCDLLVMGAHGHGILGDAMMGSISRRVLRRCKKPVLVIRLPEGKK